MPEKEPNLNLYRKRKLNGQNLIVTDQGSWCFLDDSSLAKLESLTTKSDPKELKLFEKNNLIVTDNNMKEIITQQRNLYSHLNSGPSLHIVVPTIKCNHKCIYCHSNAASLDSNLKDMDKDTARKVVDFIFESPSKSINIEFQGGEPLVKFDIVQEIISYAKSKNKANDRHLLFTLVSNLSMMDHDILKFLIKEKVNLCTSLDGPEKLHNKNRIFTGGNSYKETVYWINEIKANNNYNIDALMVTTRHSLKYAQEIVDEYKYNNLVWMRIRHLDSLGFALGKKEIDYSAEEYLEFWKNAVDYIVKINEMDKYPMVESFVKMIMQKLNGVHPFYTDFESPCGAVTGQLAYSQEGDIYTCDEGRQYKMFKLGDVFKNSYKDIISSKPACGILLSSINDSAHCDTCAYKPFCGLCPVCNYSEQNSLIPNLSSNKRCKIYKGMFDYIFSSLNSKKQHEKVFNSWLA